MANRKLGIGIIGCGIISTAHVKAYLRLDDQCEIRAVADISVDKAQALAARANGAAVYADYREMLKRDDIDMVSVCTPPFLHREQAIDALRAGKHVLCEKPMAPSLEDCDAMIAEANRSGKRLGVVFQYRYRKDFKQIKHLVSSGALGPIQFAQMNGLYWRGDTYYDEPWTWRGQFATECGGVTMNHAIHPLDIFLSVMGDIESVRAEMHTEAHDIEVEDYSSANIRFANGSLGQVNCTLNAAFEDITMAFSGKYRALTVYRATDETDVQLCAVKRDEPGGFPEIDEEALAELRRAADEIDEGTSNHTGPIRDMFDAIRSGREPVVNGREGRRTIEAITAIYKSATMEETVLLPIREEDPWYTRDGILKYVKRSNRTRKRD